MEEQKVIQQENLHSFNYLKNCNKEFIIATILNEFSDEEKKDILRHEDFIKMMDSNTLNIIVNSMNFTSGFNMLQNKLLIEKLNDINIAFGRKDSIFIKDFLNLIPINKINHVMLKNMINNVSKDDIINYFKNKDIINQLHIQDIIEISVCKRINLTSDIYLVELFSDIELYNYVDGFFKSSDTLDLAFDILKNEYVKDILFDGKIDLDDTKYLYEYLATQNNHSIKDINHSLKAFIKVNNLYEEHGLKETLELFNTKGITIDDVFTLKNKKKKNNNKTKKR